MTKKGFLVSAGLVLVISAGIAISAGALAASAGGDFVMTKSTIDGGGGTSSGGSFSLTGTIGQADASSVISTGGTFSLAGGFWASGEIVDLIFKNGFESD